MSTAAFLAPDPRTALQEQPGQESRNARVLRYRALVRPLALHYSRLCREPLEDLIQVGLLGLLRAAELYDPAREVPFEAFARPHVRGAILHYLRDAAGSVRLPRRQVELLDRLRVLGREIEARQGRIPGSEELRRALGLSVEQWHALRQGEQLRRAGSLESLGEGEGSWGVDSDPPASALPLPPAGVTVERLLAGLDPSLALLVRQVVLGGWSYRRAARERQVSPMTARRWVLGALDQLRRQWEPAACGLAQS
ncbi:MAG: sigma-70 family RNA polymerase sigma factor [Prochlorococcaceae cyanobacterium]|jgi:RNA polymerase sigma-B factor